MNLLENRNIQRTISYLLNVWLLSDKFIELHLQLIISIYFTTRLVTLIKIQKKKRVAVSFQFRFEFTSQLFWFISHTEKTPVVIIAFTWKLMASVLIWSFLLIAAAWDLTVQWLANNIWQVVHTKKIIFGILCRMIWRRKGGREGRWSALFDFENLF